MTFQEIFNQDGLYAADSFAKGVAFKIKDGIISTVTYNSIQDIFPKEERSFVYQGLFNKTYRKIFTTKQLFD